MKTYALIGAILIIGGAIYFLESKKATPKPATVLAPLEIVVPVATSSLRVQATTISPKVSSSSLEERKKTIAEKAKKYPRAKEITEPSGFINTDPFKIADFIGKKVILIDFWTYSCINCQRTFPYLSNWWEKYNDKGLLIVGVHTPEFGFEKVLANVKRATEKYGVKYPVVMDNDYGTWTAYGNRYWPREYLIDADGFIVHDHIGEGGYAETENLIRKSLAELAKYDGRDMNIESAAPEASSGEGVHAAGTPEMYFGASRNEHLGNGVKNKTGTQHFEGPSAIERNILYLVGDWDIQSEYARPLGTGAKIILKYGAQDVHMVGAGDGVGASARVLRDGASLGAAKGSAIIEEGGASKVIFKDEDLYNLIHDTAPGEHTIEIIFDGAGAEIFTFTFG